MFAIRQEGCPYHGLPNIAQPQVRVSPFRLLRIKNIVVPEQLVVGKTDVADSFPTACRLIWESYVVESNRALTIDPGEGGGAFLFHLHFRSLTTYHLSRSCKNTS